MSRRGPRARARRRPDCLRAVPGMFHSGRYETRTMSGARMRSGRCAQRRCVVCHHGFDPDPRVGQRQKTCGRAECRKVRREDSQARWRSSHPGYFIAWRAKRRAKAAASEPVDPPRTPAPLSRLPWDFAQEEFGAGGADFIASMGRLLVQHAKDERRVEVLEIIAQPARVGPPDAKFERRVDVRGSTGETGQVGGPIAKTERSPVAPSPP